jgi:ligand-binding sensor domain-containing protein/signal transduction histidine kinase
MSIMCHTRMSSERNDRVGDPTRRSHHLCMATIVLALMPVPAAAAGADLVQYAHTAWRVGERVLHADPRALAQTIDGYLWLGSDHGLVRFDGVRFTTWAPPAGRHLPSPAVVRLLGSGDGSLWIGTAMGLARFRDGELFEYEGLARTYIAALIEARDGTIWAGGGRDGSAILCAIRHPDVACRGTGQLGRFVSALFEDSRGVLWVGAATGIWRWDRDRPLQFQIPHSFPEIHAIEEDVQGHLLVAVNHEVRRFVDGRLEPYLPAGLPTTLKPTTLLHDRRGVLWIGGQDSGIVRITGGRSERFTRQDGLSGSFVSSLFEDREGNVWIGTIGGLDRFHELTVSTLSSNHGLLSERVTSVAADRDGGVWLGSIVGMNRWENGLITTPALAGRTKSYVASMYEDRAGRLWISSLTGLARVTGRISRPVAGVGTGYVHAITEDGMGNVWMAHQQRGLLRLRDSAVVEQVPWAQFRGRIGRSLAADPLRRGVWVGFFEGGLSLFANGQVAEWYDSTNGLGSGRVNHIATSSDGAAWAATEGGLSRLSNGRIRTLTVSNGLRCNRVHWAIEDDSRALWLYTECGLARIAREDLQAWLAGENATTTVVHRFFDESHGVWTTTEGTSYSPIVTKSLDGRLWFTTDQGVGVVDPNRLPFSREPPPVYVEEATADGRTYNVSTAINLPPRTRDLRIDYTALSLGAPEKVQFRYRLEGRDQEWVDAGSRRYAFYTDLPPSRYRLHVIAANSDGVWNQEGAVWEFSIAPAFYQTLAFRLSALAVAIAALRGLHRQRLRRAAAALNIRFEERLAERTRIAQELHDTLLQSFVSVSMHLHMLADDVKDHPVRPKLDTVLQRLGRALEEGRRSVSGLRTALTADDLERMLARDAEFFCGEQSTEVRIVVEGARRSLQPLVRDEVYRIVREALSNAFRHASATRIDMEFEYSDDHLRVSVRDNGQGIDEDVAAKGIDGHWGMQGMRERAESIGATLKVWSGADSGTEVELLIGAPNIFAHGQQSIGRGN